MNYFEIYQTVWNFHKKHHDMQDIDGCWKAVVEESDQIAKKYENDKFVRGLLLAVIEELQRKCKEAG